MDLISWFTPDTIPLIRKRSSQGPLAQLTEHLLTCAEEFASRNNELKSTEEGAVPGMVDALESYAVASLATGEERWSQLAVALVQAMVGDNPGSDLHRANRLKQAALHFQLHREWMRPGDQKALATRLLQLAVDLQEVRTGNPDNPFNNWWGVTHSSAGLAALVVRDLEPEADRILDLEMERIRSYLTNYGDGGHYYEGTGYGFYAMSHWAPFLLACRGTLGVELDDLNPGIRNIAALAYTMTAPVPFTETDPEHSSCAEGLGIRVAWNDDGHQWPRRGIPAYLFGISAPAHLGALRYLHDRLSGELGDKSWRAPGNCPHWSLALYPVDVHPEPPEPALGRHRVDLRNGLVVARNRFKDKDDCVFAAYARAYHPGGHRHDDAGSWRLLGLGRAWSQAGGQAKLSPWYQSGLLRRRLDAAPEQFQSHHHATGRLGAIAPLPDGSRATLRLGPVYDSGCADRHFAVHFPEDDNVVAVVGSFDYIIDHEGSEWAWNLCYDPELKFEENPTGPGFVLRDPDTGASLTAHVLAPVAFEMDHHLSPPSERTFSNGRHVVYPGVPYINLRAQMNTGFFFVVMTLQRHEAPPLTVEGRGMNVRALVCQRAISLRRNRWFEGPLLISKS